MPTRLPSVTDQVAEIVAKFRGEIDECWIVPFKDESRSLQFWSTSSYAQYNDGRPLTRLVYKIFVGPIPEDFVVDHVWSRGCRSKRCINPFHLEAVSRSVNRTRGHVHYRGVIL